MTTPRKKEDKPRPLAPKSKAHTKAVFHRLFECAMRWRYLEVQRNPMSLIELQGSSKRTRKIVLVTTGQRRYERGTDVAYLECVSFSTLSHTLPRSGHWQTSVRSIVHTASDVRSISKKADNVK
jgi:hypothetical protein